MLLALVGVLLLAALAASAAVLYRAVYSPSAFVERYLELLENQRAADAMMVPGVALDRDALAEAGVDAPLSDALLRSAALAELSSIQIVSEVATDDVWTVSASYIADGQPGQTSFLVTQDGWSGIVPRWRFARPPLAVIELVVRGADAFAVNGFAIDRRQIAGVDSDPLNAVALLALTPGMYTVTVDTPIAYHPGVHTLIDRSLAVTPVGVQARPTGEFRDAVQERVTEFLDDCATQQVLLPTGCPFGFEVRHRITSLPLWSIVQHPEVEIGADGAHWQIIPADAVAHLTVDVQSIFDGTIRRLSEDVVFQVSGTVTILPDGSVSIRVKTP